MLPLIISTLGWMTLPLIPTILAFICVLIKTRNDTVMRITEVNLIWISASVGVNSVLLFLLMILK